MVHFHFLLQLRYFPHAAFNTSFQDSVPDFGSEMSGIYEIRVQSGNDIFRIFCFFDEGKLIVLMNGFQKKTQKTPAQELAKAIKIKREYYEEKKHAKKP